MRHNSFKAAFSSLLASTLLVTSMALPTTRVLAAAPDYSKTVKVDDKTINQGDDLDLLSLITYQGDTTNPPQPSEYNSLNAHQTIKDLPDGGQFIGTYGVNIEPAPAYNDLKKELDAGKIANPERGVWQKFYDHTYYFYKDGDGWYDCNKWYRKEQRPYGSGGTDDNACWFCVSSNQLSWWINQNQKYIKRYFEVYPEEEQKIDNPKKTPILEAAKYNEKEYAPILDFFIEIFIDKGGSPTGSNRWFIDGEKTSELNAPYKPQEEAKFNNFKGYFSKVFKDHYDLNGLLKIAGGTTDAEHKFSNFVKEALLKKQAVGFELLYREKSNYRHAVTLWGAEFDKDGIVRKIYYSNSDEQNDEFITIGKLEKISVFYQNSTLDSSKQEVVMMPDGIDKPNKYAIPIISACSLDLGHDTWERWYQQNLPAGETGRPTFRVKDNGGFDKNKPGEYTVTFEDLEGNEVPKKAKVTVLAKGPTPEEQAALAQAKQEAQTEIQNLPYLTEAHKKALLAKVEKMTAATEKEQILKEAQAQNETDKQAALQNEKMAAKQQLAKLTNLTDEHRQAFLQRIEALKEPGTSQAILEEAKQADQQDLADKQAKEAAEKLANAKANAKERIDALTDLTAEHKQEFLGKLDNADTPEAVEQVVEAAKEQAKKDRAEKDQAEQAASLAAAKDAAKAKIAELQHLDTTEKAEFNQQIDQITEPTQADAIVEAAKQKDAAKEQAEKDAAMQAALEQAKSDAKTEINGLSDLTDEHKQNFLAEVDKATKQAQVSEIVDRAKEQAALDKQAKEDAEKEAAKQAALKQAKDTATTKINDLSDLSADEKKVYLDKVEAASTEAEVQAVVTEAEQQNKANAEAKAEAAKQAAALKQAKEEASAKIKALQDLTAEQQQAFLAKVEAAKTVKEVNQVLEAAEAQAQANKQPAPKPDEKPNPDKQPDKQPDKDTTTPPDKQPEHQSHNYLPGLIGVNDHTVFINQTELAQAKVVRRAGVISKTGEQAGNAYLYAGILVLVLALIAAAKAWQAKQIKQEVKVETELNNIKQR